MLMHRCKFSSVYQVIAKIEVILTTGSLQPEQPLNILQNGRKTLARLRKLFYARRA